MAKRPKTPTETESLSFLQRLSLNSFTRPRTIALIWLVVLLFGAASYTTLLKREGFPSINTPFALAKGTYLVNNPAKVNDDIATPLSNYLLRQPGVKSVQFNSLGNYYTAQISYEESVTDATAKSKQLSTDIASKKILPAQATLSLNAFEFGFTDRGDDLVVSLYSKTGNANTETLAKQAKTAADYLRNKHLPLVQSVSIIDPYEQAKDPLTGQSIATQKSFDSYGERNGNQNKFYNSVVIGVKSTEGADELKLDDQMRQAVTDLNKTLDNSGYQATVSASNAPQINEQIGELQKSLLEGLFVVLIIGSLIIAIRASMITVLSMITVIAVTNGVLFLTGYSLNTITLFALILGLSLIVDDTIIMVEALDAQRRRQKEASKAVSEATGKVSGAMIAATSTAVLSFAPLLFVGGILGGFIRAIPVTIIASLLISLVVALVFIPLFARYLILTKKQLGGDNVHEPAARIEARIARVISAPMLWAKGSTKKLLGVGIVAVIIGTSFIIGSGVIFQKVTFNIFPPSKDDNQISTIITYKPDTSITEAQDIAGDANKILSSTLGDNLVTASYYGSGSVQSATLTVNIKDYKKRDVTSPQLVKQLNDKYASFSKAKVEASSLGVGPPAATFVTQIRSDKNRQGAVELANNVADYLRNDAVLKRSDGTIAKIKSVDIGNASVFTQKDGHQYIEVSTNFVDDDSSTLVTLAKDNLKKKYGDSQVASYNLGSNAVTYDSGQEEENQDSFKTLALAFPLLLVVIYVVLSFQFRSLLQPLLIFMAIPFSLFGITLGLYLTNNPFSFFAALGFFALIGLSLKNTILLTDYANQARRSGMGTVDAAHEALTERFRPLIATSLTAVMSLIPLALSSPFWEGLAVVLIFGLLSSTFLVLTVFPYYYLGSEFLRQHIGRIVGIGWVALTVVLAIGFAQISGAGVLLAPFVAALVLFSIRRFSSRINS